MNTRIKSSAAAQPQHLRHRWRRRDMNSAAKGLYGLLKRIGWVAGARGFSCSLLSAMARLVKKSS